MKTANGDSYDSSLRTGSSWPGVTALVLCYNHARFVVEALESVSAQNYPNLQLIVADDCSKDDSVKVIRAWLEVRQPDALFLPHQSNLGICATLNEMLARAQGKYVALLAADDVWLAGRLREQVERMESLPEEVGVLYGDAYQVDEAGCLLPDMFIAAHRKFSTMPEGRIFDTLLDGNFIPAMTTLIRRRCFEEVGGYDEALVYEDFDMWLRIARRFQFRFWPRVSANYRILPSSMMRSRSDAIYRSTQRIFIKCLHQGWLTGERRTWARLLDYDHVLDHYHRKSPQRFGEVYRLCCRHPSPKNLLLLTCCLGGLPEPYYHRLRHFGKGLRRTMKGG